MTEKGKSANGGWHSLTRGEKLYVAIAVPMVLVGMVGLVATVILLVASFFLPVPRLGWLICFGATATVLAGLFAEPYVRIFFGGGWMVFRNNVIFFWLLVLASGTATFKSFASPARTVILATLLALPIVDGALRIGYIQATWFFVKRRHAGLRSRS